MFCLPPHGDLSHRLFFASAFFALFFLDGFFGRIFLSRLFFSGLFLSWLFLSRRREPVTGRTITVTAVCFLFIITYMLRDFHMFFKLFALAMACVKSVEKEKRAAGSPEAQDDKTQRAVP